MRACSMACTLPEHGALRAACVECLQTPSWHLPPLFYLRARLSRDGDCEKPPPFELLPCETCSAGRHVLGSTGRCAIRRPTVTSYVSAVSPRLAPLGSAPPSARPRALPRRRTEKKARWCAEPCKGWHAADERDVWSEGPSRAAVARPQAWCGRGGLGRRHRTAPAAMSGGRTTAGCGSQALGTEPPAPRRCCERPPEPPRAARSAPRLTRSLALRPQAAAGAAGGGPHLLLRPQRARVGLHHRRQARGPAR